MQMIVNKFECGLRCPATASAVYEFYVDNGKLATEVRDLAVFETPRLVETESINVAEGKFRQGFSLDGVDDFVNVPDSASNSITGPLSIDAWIRPSTLVGAGEGHQAIVSKYDSGNNQVSYTFQILNGGRLQFGVAQNGSGSVFRQVTTTNPITAGVFSHVAGTFDPATQAMNIYVNGVAVPTTLDAGSTTVNSIFDGTAPFRIGAFAGVNSGNDLHFFNGVIDEVGVYSRLLTPAEVHEPVNEGNGV